MLQRNILRNPELSVVSTVKILDIVPNCATEKRNAHAAVKMDTLATIVTTAKRLNAQIATIVTSATVATAQYIGKLWSNCSNSAS